MQLRSIIPTVIESSARGERAFDIYSLLLRERIVFLGSEVDDDVANVIIAQMLYLEAEDPDKDITLYINSPGGLAYAGMAIYDVMQHVQLRGIDDLCRHGDVGGGDDPRRRRGWEAVRAPLLEGHDPPGKRRNARRPERHGDSTAGGACPHATDGRDHRVPQRETDRPSQARYRPGLLPHSRGGVRVRADRRDHRSSTRHRRTARPGLRTRRGGPRSGELTRALTTVDGEQSLHQDALG